MRMILLLLVYLITISVCSYAFDDVSTHPSLTQEAVNNSRLKYFLINQLGVSQKIDEKYLVLKDESYSMVKLLREGSTDEDDPLWRASNHFHDPLKPWGDAQLDSSFNDILCWVKDSPFERRYSNLILATGYESEGVLYTGYEKEGVYYPETVNNDPAVNKGRNWDVARNF